MRVLSICAMFVVCSALQAQVTVINGASFRREQPITGGSWASAFGTFTGVTSTTATVSPLPKNLGGVTVSVDGTEAPVYFVSAGQINFLIPGSVAPGIRPVEVKTAGATVTGSVRVISSGPGLFVKDATTQLPPKGAILNQDSTENTSSNLARRGQVIQIYGTGPGALDGTIADGAPAPSSPLVRTKSRPQVFIGGVEAQVDFSGMAPQLAGVWQINAFIPDRPFISGRVPVIVFMDGVDSNEVTIFVAQ
jgi:uncharacterized protein (TIGR03437 family)